MPSVTNCSICIPAKVRFLTESLFILSRRLLRGCNQDYKVVYKLVNYDGKGTAKLPKFLVCLKCVCFAG